MQGIVVHFVAAFGVLKPVPAFHATVGAIVYGAEVLHLHKKAIAIKGKMVKRIINQAFFAHHRILFPFALQISRTFALVGRVELTGGKKQEARGKKQEAFLLKAKC